MNKKLFVFVLIIVSSLTLFAVLKTKNKHCSEFEESKIEINKKNYSVYLAKGICQLEKGLMNSNSLDKDGMLFIFETEKKPTFWMKNTKIPLSIAYVSKDGIILEMHDMFPENVKYDHEYKTFSSRHMVKYALEVNFGFFSKENIKLGDKITMENL